MVDIEKTFRWPDKARLTDTTAVCKILGKVNLEQHHQVGIVNRNICAEYELKLPRSR